MAIVEWGRPATDIMHLVVTTNSGGHIPGVDFRLVQLLGLRPSVRCTMIHLNACFSGAAALPLAKDLAENNRGARVLVVCAELTIMHFAKLKHNRFFGDGASGDLQEPPPERPIYEMAWAAQTIILETEDAMGMRLTNRGLDGGGAQVHYNLAELIGGYVGRCVAGAFSPLGVDPPPAWNDLFWVLHPGQLRILNRVQAVLQLKPEKLAASRRVLSEYGNMFGVTVIFILDEMRRTKNRGREELDWGVLMAFGPGATFETMVLRAA